jgi:hypothetical protein
MPTGGGGKNNVAADTGGKRGCLAGGLFSRPVAWPFCSRRRYPKNRYCAGTQTRVAGFDSRIMIQRRHLMRSKLAISALVVASLFGATAIASAQTQPAAGASSEGNVGPGATDTKMKSGKMKMKSSKMKSGTTTGMSGSSKKGDNATKNSDSK